MRRGDGACIAGAPGVPVGVVGGEELGECVAAEAKDWLVTNAGYCDGCWRLRGADELFVNGWTAKGSKEASGDDMVVMMRGVGEVVRVRVAEVERLCV